MKTMDRRQLLKTGLGAAAGFVVAPLWAAQASKLPTQALAGKATLISGAPGNVIAVNTTDGVVLVDAGAADSARAVLATLDGA